MSLRKSQDKFPIEKKLSVRRTTNIGALINKPDYFYETIRNKGFAHVSYSLVFLLKLTG